MYKTHAADSPVKMSNVVDVGRIADGMLPRETIASGVIGNVIDVKDSAE